MRLWGRFILAYGLAVLLAVPTLARAGGGLDPKQILEPVPGSWPTYSGDYSGERHSPLKQINRGNVQKLILIRSLSLDPSSEGAVIGGGMADSSIAARPLIRGGLIIVGGVLYVSAVSHVWAVDLHSGAQLWHYVWNARRNAIGNRGVGMWKNNIYVETPDDYLVSLDARSGKENWHVPIAKLEEEYFATAAPVIVGNHVLVGTGNDSDMPGFLQSYDPESGALQWRTYMVPMREGDPGLETWKNLDAARHGGGNAWLPGSYDAQTHLYIIGTGNPSPAFFPEVRGNKDALFTCSLVAIDVDSGKMRWHYQLSPNDTHDWDAGQTPVLADIQLNGHRHKVVMTAARNGYFFVLDRTTGEHLLTSKFSDTVNWALPQLNPQGQPVRNPDKDHAIGGALVSSATHGTTNWYPPAFSPEHHLYYVQTHESWGMLYTAETDPRGSMGLGGREDIYIGADDYLKAIDVSTGRIGWSIKYPRAGMNRAQGGSTGLLTTAGDLLFGDDRHGNFVARDAGNGQPLWHYAVPGVMGRGGSTNAPTTFMLDGKQYVVVASGLQLLLFALP